MIKISSIEKNKKPIKVFHATKHDYKYPFVNPNFSAPNGYGGNVYGRGFYTTNDKDVLEGYKKTIENPIIRKQILPKGTTILNYNNLNDDWIKIISDFIKKNFIYLKQVRSMPIKNINIFDIISTFNVDRQDDIYNRIMNKLPPFLLDKGIDVIKYKPGEFVKSNKKLKGYNYLILNKDILNLPEESQKEFIENSDYINEYWNTQQKNLSLEELETIKEFYPEIYEKIKFSSNKNIKLMADILDNNFKDLMGYVNSGHMYRIFDIMSLTNNYNFIYYLNDKLGPEETHRLIDPKIAQTFIEAMPEKLKQYHYKLLEKEKQNVIEFAKQGHQNILFIRDFLKIYPHTAQEIYDNGDQITKKYIIVNYPIYDDNINAFKLLDTKYLIQAIHKQKYTLDIEQKKELIDYYKNNDLALETLRTLFPELDWYNA